VKPRKAVIPAAGLGTRFLPATKAVPKELLPIVDIPTIQYVAQEIVDSGLTDVVLINGRGKSAIEDHFDVSYELERTLEEKGKHELLRMVRDVAKMVHVVSVRQKNPLGLGHAVLMARQYVGDEPFAVLLGDVIIDAKVPCTKQLIDVFETHGPVIALLAVPEDRTQHYGVISGKKVGDRLYHVDKLVEKPAPGTAPSNLSVLGRYVLPPSIFEILERTKPGKGGEIQLTDALMTMAGDVEGTGGVYGVVFRGRRYDTGDKLDYIKAVIQLAADRDDLGPELKPWLVEYVAGLERS